jgi:hypothetical protein
MPWYLWLALGLLLGGASAFLAVMFYLAKGFRR